MEFSYSQKLSSDTGYFKKPVEINRGFDSEVDKKFFASPSIHKVTYMNCQICLFVLLNFAKKNLHCAFGNDGGGSAPLRGIANST